MTTYVLGAGASVHAGYPLTTQLGDRLLRWAQQGDFTKRGFIEDLQDLYGGLADLEQIVTELHERPAGSEAAKLTQMQCGNTIGALEIGIPEFFHAVRNNTIRGSDLYGTLAHEKICDGDDVLPSTTI